MIAMDKLTMGVLFPIEAFEGPIPQMNKEEQIRLAQQAESLGFDTLWRGLPKQPQGASAQGKAGLY